MPIPAVLGVSWLAGVIGTAFAGLFAWLLTFMTKRLAIVVLAVGVLLTLTASLFVALESLLSGLVYILPASLTQSVGLFAPSNLSLCVSIVVSAHMLRYVYDWNVRVVQMKLI